MATGVVCINSNSTAATLVELAALGAQDVLLTCDPKCSLFHQSYCRITNFAMGEQTLCFQNAPSGQAWVGANCIRAEALRAGDLLGPVYLDGCLSGLPRPQIDDLSPSSSLDVKMWTPAVGYAIISGSKVIIGSQEFESAGGEVFLMTDEISRKEGHRASKLIGDYGAHLRGCAVQNTTADGLSAVGSDEKTLQAGIEYSTRSQKILAPLKHFWVSHPGNYLNVVGAQYHNIVLELDIRPYSDVTLGYRVDRSTGEMAPQSNGVSERPALGSNNGVLSGLSILGVYVQLDTAERRLKAQAAQTLRFVYKQDTTYSTVSTDAGATKEVSNFFNHPVTRIIWAWRATKAITENRHEWFEWGAYRGARLLVGEGEDYAMVQEVVPEITQFEMLINNHSRVHQAAEYFLYAQPYAHASRVPDRIVYSYTFAMYPDADDIHSGSLNLSRIDNVVLRFTFKSQAGNAFPLAANDYLTASDSVAGLNTVQVGTGFVNSLPLTETAPGTTAGTILFHAETINFYKQAAGMFGLLFAN